LPTDIDESSDAVGALRSFSDQAPRSDFKDALVRASGRASRIGPGRGEIGTKCLRSCFARPSAPTAVGAVRERRPSPGSRAEFAHGLESGNDWELTVRCATRWTLDRGTALPQASRPAHDQPVGLAASTRHTRLPGYGLRDCPQRRPRPDASRPEGGTDRKRLVRARCYSPGRRIVRPHTDAPVADTRGREALEARDQVLPRGGTVVGGGTSGPT